MQINYFFVEIHRPGIQVVSLLPRSWVCLFVCMCTLVLLLLLFYGYVILEIIFTFISSALIGARWCCCWVIGWWTARASEPRPCALTATRVTHLRVATKADTRRTGTINTRYQCSTVVLYVRDERRLFVLLTLYWNVPLFSRILICELNEYKELD